MAWAWIFLGLALMGGCATESVPPPPGPQAATPPSARSDPKAPVLGLEYGNKSTRATLEMDLGDQDIQVEMTGNRSAPDTVRTRAPAASAFARTADDSGAAWARRIVDSASARPSSSLLPDSVTTRVVAAIRMAQEAFYKGRYREAYDQARRSISIHATPEGCALAGSAAWVLKDMDSARRFWLQARALEPDFPGLSPMLDSLPSEREASP